MLYVPIYNCDRLCMGEYQWYDMYSYQLIGLRTCETGFHVCSLTFYIQLHVYYIYCLRSLLGTQVDKAVEWREHKQHEETCDITDGLHYNGIPAGKSHSVQLLWICTVC